jgi:hypothetical protein
MALEQLRVHREQPMVWFEAAFTALHGAPSLLTLHGSMQGSTQSLTHETALKAGILTFCLVYISTPIEARLKWLLILTVCEARQSHSNASCVHHHSAARGACHCKG